MEKHLAQHNYSLPVIGNGLTKTQIADIATEAVGTVLDKGNALQVAEALAAMEEFTKGVRKDKRYVEFLREELFKHNGRYQTTSGARLEVCEAGVSYDYSSNPEWRRLNSQILELMESRKELEAELRRISSGKIIVDEETGEILEGPQRKSTSTYRITLAR